MTPESEVRGKGGRRAPSAFERVSSRFQARPGRGLLALFLEGEEGGSWVTAVGGLGSGSACTALGWNGM